MSLTEVTLDIYTHISTFSQSFTSHQIILDQQIHHHLQQFTRPPVLQWVVPIVSTLLPRFGGAEPGRKSKENISKPWKGLHKGQHSATFQQNFWEFIYIVVLCSRGMNNQHQPCTAYIMTGLPVGCSKSWNAIPALRICSRTASTVDPTAPTARQCGHLSMGVSPSFCTLLQLLLGLETQLGFPKCLSFIRVSPCASTHLEFLKFVTHQKKTTCVTEMTLRPSISVRISSALAWCPGLRSCTEATAQVAARAIISSKKHCTLEVYRE